VKLYKANGQGIFVNNILNVDTIQLLDQDILLVKYKNGNEIVVDNYKIIAEPKAKIEKLSDIIDKLPKASDRIQSHSSLYDIQLGDIIEYKGNAFIVDQNIFNKIKLDILGDNNCVVCYELDGNANDLSGKFNGVWIGTEEYDNGVFGQAAKLNNNTGIYSTVNQILDDELSMTFWFKFIKVNSNVDHDIIFNCGEGICELSISISDGKSLFYASGDNWVWKDSGVDLETNVFNYFAITYKRSTGLFEIYLNNNKIVSYQNNPSSKPFGNVSNAITFGFRQDNPNNTPTRFITGLIDQIRIFNRIITADEIQLIYQETSPIVKKII